MKTISTWWREKDHVKPVFPKKCLVCRSADDLKSLKLGLEEVSECVSVYYCADHYDNAERFLQIMQKDIKEVNEDISDAVGEIGLVLIILVVSAVFCGGVTRIEIGGFVGLSLGLLLLFFKVTLSDVVRHLPLIGVMFRARKFVKDWGEDTMGLMVDMYLQSDGSMRVDFTFDEDEIALDFEALQLAENLKPLG